MIYAERPGNNLVSSAEVTDPWAKDYSCPDCTQKTHFVKAHLRDVGSTQVYVMPHFRHNPSQEATGLATATECSVAEHSEHERMRTSAFNMLKDRCANGSTKIPDDFPAYTAAAMDTGPQGGTKTKSISGRHPDAYIEFDDSDDQYGCGIVLEVQYQHSDKPIKQVTHDYLDAGYSILWTRPKDYTDTGHGVERNNIITPNVDYPFIDEYRATQWADLFTANTAIELFDSDSPSTEAIQPLLTDVFATQATFREQWITSLPPVVENTEPTLDSTTDEIEPSEIDGDVPFEIQPFLDRDEKSCYSCENVPSYIIVPHLDRANTSHHLPLCDDCTSHVMKGLLRMHHYGELEPEDFLDIEDWPTSSRLYSVAKLVITDYSAKKQYRLEATQLDDPVERLRVEFNSEHEEVAIHLPSRFFKNLKLDSCTMTIERQSSRIGRTNPPEFEIVDVEDGYLHGLDSKKFVGRIER